MRQSLVKADASSASFQTLVETPEHIIINEMLYASSFK